METAARRCAEIARTMSATDLAVAISVLGGLVVLAHLGRDLLCFLGLHAGSLEHHATEPPPSGTSWYRCTRCGGFVEREP